MTITTSKSWLHSPAPSNRQDPVHPDLKVHRQSQELNATTSDASVITDHGTLERDEHFFRSPSVRKTYIVCPPSTFLNPQPSTPPAPAPPVTNPSFPLVRNQLSLAIMLSQLQVLAVLAHAAASSVVPRDTYYCTFWSDDMCLTRSGGTSYATSNPGVIQNGGMCQVAFDLGCPVALTKI